MQNFIIKITQKNSPLPINERIGCYIITSDLSDKLITQIVDKAHEKTKLVLSAGDSAPELYKNFCTDGFILDCSRSEHPQTEVKAARQKYPHAIIGVISRNRRHEAMLISECEPDFIIFQLWREGLEKNIELLQWYTDLFLIQCAAYPKEEMDLNDIPADFLILPDTDQSVTKI